MKNKGKITEEGKRDPKQKLGALALAAATVLSPGPGAPTPAEIQEEIISRPAIVSMADTKANTTESIPVRLSAPQVSSLDETKKDYKKDTYTKDTDTTTSEEDLNILEDDEYLEQSNQNIKEKYEVISDNNQRTVDNTLNIYKDVQSNLKEEPTHQEEEKQNIKVDPDCDEIYKGIYMNDDNKDDVYEEEPPVDDSIDEDVPVIVSETDDPLPPVDDSIDEDIPVIVSETDDPLPPVDDIDDEYIDNKRDDAPQVQHILEFNTADKNYDYDALHDLNIYDESDLDEEEDWTAISFDVIHDSIDKILPQHDIHEIAITNYMALQSEENLEYISKKDYIMTANQENLKTMKICVDREVLNNIESFDCGDWFDGEIILCKNPRNYNTLERLFIYENFYLKPQKNNVTVNLLSAEEIEEAEILEKHLDEYENNIRMRNATFDDRTEMEKLEIIIYHMVSKTIASHEVFDYEVNADSIMSICAVANRFDISLTCEFGRLDGKDYCWASYPQYNSHGEIESKVIIDPFTYNPESEGYFLYGGSSFTSYENEDNNLLHYKSENLINGLRDQKERDAFLYTMRSGS